MLALTCPEGMSIQNWTEVLTEAKASMAQWPDDPWAELTDNVREFLGGADTPTCEQAPEADRGGRAATRAEFVAAWAMAPRTGQNASKRSVVDALAGFADSDGANAHPAVSTLATKARVSARTVQRSLTWAQDEGWIIPTGTSSSGTTVWHLAVPDLPNTPADDVLAA